MMQEGVHHRDYRRSSREHRRSSPRVMGMVWVSSPTRKAPRRTTPGHIAPLTVIRRIVAAIRLWRQRGRSRQELRGLSDRMLKDIGLRREDVGFGSPTRLWHCG